MPQVIGDYTKRFRVEVSLSEYHVDGSRSVGEYSFDRAFDDLSDATSYANRIAEDHEFVRVLDMEVS